jgi:hypothetical protein
MMGNVIRAEGKAKFYDGDDYPAFVNIGLIFFYKIYAFGNVWRCFGHSHIIQPAFLYFGFMF